MPSGYHKYKHITVNQLEALEAAKGEAFALETLMRGSSILSKEVLHRFALLSSLLTKASGTCIEQSDFELANDFLRRKKTKG